MSAEIPWMRPIPHQPPPCRPDPEPHAHTDYEGYSPLGLILESKKLRRIAQEFGRDWTEEPKYPELRARLIAAYYDSGTIPTLRGDIEELLGLPAPRTDTERLDWVLSFLSEIEGISCSLDNPDLKWARTTIDRYMAESELQARKSPGPAGR